MGRGTLPRVRKNGPQRNLTYMTLTISPLNVCFQTLDPLNSSSSDNLDEKIVYNCISNLYIPAKLVTSRLQLSQTKFISILVQENIFGVLTSSKISLRSLGVKWLRWKKTLETLGWKKWSWVLQAGGPLL